MIKYAIKGYSENNVDSAFKLITYETEPGKVAFNPDALTVFNAPKLDKEIKDELNSLLTKNGLTLNDADVQILLHKLFVSELVEMVKVEEKKEEV